MGLSYSLFPPPAWTVWLQHALLFQRPIQFFKQGQEMLGVHLLCSFGGDNAPGTRDVLLLLQVTPEGVNKTSASG